MVVYVLCILGGLVVGGVVAWLIAAGRLSRTIRDELSAFREEFSRDGRALREEVARAQKGANESTINAIGQLGAAQRGELESIRGQINELTTSNTQALEQVRNTVESKMRELREGNEAKLEQMRATVDEKLHETLERRLSESFKLVGDHLEAVQKGLGEMKSLAADVGGLKRVLTNVKERGTWGELRLGALLEQALTPEQYEQNVRVKEHSDEVVEFAVKLPGRDEDIGHPVWLPIDAKFPNEDYERLVDASENADAEGVKAATDSLAKSIRKYAKDISDKYISPPNTTDFAIMFLPTEGLFAEVLRQPGLHQELHLKYHVMPAGPTTLLALLDSLQMGFRTLAIEKRASEVWATLGAIKTEFTKFGEVLATAKRHLDNAASTLEKASTRTRAMQRKLKEVERVPADEASNILQLPGEADLKDSEQVTLDEEESDSPDTA